MRPNAYAIEQGTQDAVTMAPHVRTAAAAALDFLHRQAPGTGFESAAILLFEGKYVASGSRSLNRRASTLEDWVDHLEKGHSDAVGPEARARLAASTDLMEQGQQLLADKSVHPAAPIVLYGCI